MPAAPLTSLDPVPVLVARVRAELSADFSRPGRRASAAPGRLDVMGGIADYTGSLVCEATLDRAAAVALQERDDRQLQVFSLQPLRRAPARSPSASRSTRWRPTRPQALRREFDRARPQVGGVRRRLPLRPARSTGSSICATRPSRGSTSPSTARCPLGAGVSSSAAIEVATMMNLARCTLDLLDGSSPASPIQNPRCNPNRSRRCARRAVPVGREPGRRRPVRHHGPGDELLGEAGTLLRMVCQPHELQSPLHAAGRRARSWGSTAT